MFIYVSWSSCTSTFVVEVATPWTHYSLDDENWTEVMTGVMVCDAKPFEDNNLMNLEREKKKIMEIELLWNSSLLTLVTSFVIWITRNIKHL